MSKIYILMATYNGSSFISEQISSILNQTYIDWELWVSDDQSSDGTLDIVKAYSKKDPRIKVLDSKSRHGSAGKNFFNALKTIDLCDCGYVAFADQDDVWNSDKLQRSISEIVNNNASGYSSDVVAFWPNGRKKYIKKSGNQKKWDYLFEPGGPGCTYVIKSNFAQLLQCELREGKIDPGRVYAHDWLIYAKARSHGLKWVIDQTPSLMYRQHINNEVGVNVGYKSIVKRIQRLRCGWYLDQVYQIAGACGELDQLEILFGARNSTRIIFVSKFTQARRSFFEALLLLLFMIFRVAR